MILSVQYTGWNILIKYANLSNRPFTNVFNGALYQIILPCLLSLLGPLCGRPRPSKQAESKMLSWKLDPSAGGPSCPGPSVRQVFLTSESAWLMTWSSLVIFLRHLKLSVPFSIWKLWLTLNTISIPKGSIGLLYASSRSKESQVWKQPVRKCRSRWSSNH